MGDRELGGGGGGYTGVDIMLATYFWMISGITVNQEIFIAEAEEHVTTQVGRNKMGLWINFRNSM